MIEAFDIILDDTALTELMNPRDALYRVKFTVEMDDHRSRLLVGMRDGDVVRRHISAVVWMHLGSSDPQVRMAGIEAVHVLAQEIIVELSQVWHLFHREPLLAYHLDDMLDFWGINLDEPTPASWTKRAVAILFNKE